MAELAPSKDNKVNKICNKVNKDNKACSKGSKGSKACSVRLQWVED